MAGKSVQRSFDAVEPWGVSVHPSLRSSIHALGIEECGKPVCPGIHSLHLNAAIAMYFFATPDDRDHWMELVELARSERDGAHTITETIEQLREESKARAEEAKRQAAPPPLDPDKITRIFRK